MENMPVQKLFMPGMWFMRHMRMASKLLVLGLIALVPMCVLQWQLLRHQHQQLDHSRDAVAGALWVGDVATLARLTQNHRGQTNLMLAADAGAANARVSTQGALKQSLSALQARSQAGSNWPALKDWPALVQRIEALLAVGAGSDPAQSFAAHTRVVEDLQHLAQAVALDTSLGSDAQVEISSLAPWVSHRNMQWAEQLARLRGLGAGLINQGQTQSPAAQAVLFQLDALEASLRDLGGWQQALAGVQTGVDPQLLAQALERSRAFAALARERFGAQAQGTDANAYFASGSAALDAVSAFHAAAVAQLVQRLQADESATLWTYRLTFGLSVFGVLLMAYLMVAFRFSFLADLNQVLLFLQQMADGNLRHRARVRGRDELSDMSSAMDRMVHNFSSMVASVRSNAALVLQSGTDLVQASGSLADRTEQQAANLEQTNASVQELSSNVQSNARAAQESDGTARGVRDLAEKGADSMQQAVAQIEAIQDSTRRMDEIVAVIDGLAFQTNILALNAAVEAARAGESGRGFAVVASEVRSLAQRSASSAKEIRSLIGTSTHQVEEGVQLIRAAGQSIGAVVEGIRAVAQKMSAVSSGSSEQSAGLAEISAAVRQLDQITQHNAAMVESAAQQATALQGQAHTLSESVSVFKLQQGTADEARALVDKALAFKAGCRSRDEYLRAITFGKQGEFHDRDMYVFVLDPDGTYLAFGGNPAKANTRVQDIPGIDGQGLMNDIVRQAKATPGWVQYDITNPTTGKIQTKMSYVVEAELDFIVGCGVYKHFTG